MTKNLHDEALKNSLTIEDAKVEVIPEMIKNSLDVPTPAIVRKPKSKMKVRTVKSKVPVKRSSRLEKAQQPHIQKSPRKTTSSGQ